VKRIAKFVLKRVRQSPAAGLPPAPPRLLVFDFDGTIADTFEAGFEILNLLSGEFGFRRLERDQLELARGMRTRQLMKYLGMPVTKMSAIARRGSEELSARIHGIQPLPGVPEALHELRAQGFEMGIITSNSQANVTAFLRTHRLEMFSFIRSSSKLMGKAREIRAAAKSQRLRLDEMFFIGDETRDIEACRKCGLPIAAVTWGYNTAASLKSLEPDFVFDTPADLVAMLVSWKANR